MCLLIVLFMPKSVVITEKDCGDESPEILLHKSRIRFLREQVSSRATDSAVVAEALKCYSEGVSDELERRNE